MLTYFMHFSVICGSKFELGGYNFEKKRLDTKFLLSNDNTKSQQQEVGRQHVDSPV